MPSCKTSYLVVASKPLGGIGVGGASYFAHYAFAERKSRDIIGLFAWWDNRAHKVRNDSHLLCYASVELLVASMESGFFRANDL